MRINAHAPGLQSSQLGSTSSQGDREVQQKQAEPLKTVGDQLTQNIFTRPRPMLLEGSDYPDLQKLLSLLEPFRRKLAFLAGDQDADYALVLAADGSAAIDDRGLIFLGAGFLRAHENNLPVLVGAIAHEIGHQPKRMRQLANKRDLTPEMLNALLITEEIRADRFAGFGLGHLGMSVEPLIDYLKAVNAPPHPAYLPVEDRARMLREGFASGQTRDAASQKIFPDLYRHRSMRNHIGVL